MLTVYTGQTCRDSLYGNAYIQSHALRLLPRGRSYIQKIEFILVVANAVRPYRNHFEHRILPKTIEYSNTNGKAKFRTNTNRYFPLNARVFSSHYFRPPYTRSPHSPTNRPRRNFIFVLFPTRTSLQLLKFISSCYCVHQNSIPYRLNKPYEG